MDQWPYIEGHYLSTRNVDLYRLLCKYNGVKSFNIIDSVIIDEALRDGDLESPRQRLKATINKLYDRIKVEGSSNDEGSAGNFRSVSDMQPPDYLEANEDGYPGLDAPLG